jgi:hypothetical protein
MATYDPPQPMSKRIVAGILDFLLAFFGIGFVLGKIFPAEPHAAVKITGAATTEVFALSGWPALLLIALIVAYFVVLGRTGGTVFQRLFRMKRARKVAAAA